VCGRDLDAALAEITSLAETKSAAERALDECRRTLANKTDIFENQLAHLHSAIGALSQEKAQSEDERDEYIASFEAEMAGRINTLSEVLFGAQQRVAERDALLLSAEEQCLLLDNQLRVSRGRAEQARGEVARAEEENERLALSSREVLESVSEYIITQEVKPYK
jgi:hypothetical protein